MESTKKEEQPKVEQKAEAIDGAPKEEKKEKKDSKAERQKKKEERLAARQ